MLNRQFAHGPLAEVFFDFNAERIQFLAVWMLPQAFSQLQTHPVGDQFRRGVGDGKQNAIFAREDPAAFFEGCRDFTVVGGHLDLGMRRRQQHAMVETIDQLLRGVSQRDEVEDVAVFVQWPGDFDGDSPVVAMQSLADVTVESDEVSGTEDQVVLRDADAILFFHIIFLRAYLCEDAERVE